MSGSSDGSGIAGDSGAAGGSGSSDGSGIAGDSGAAGGSGGRLTLLGHLCGLFAALNWGFTFILTDIAMGAGLTAYEALLLRSLTAYVFLWVICPKAPRLALGNGLAGLARAEWPYLVAGLSGLSIYFLLDYNALNYTSASFVTILCGTVPLFIAMALWIAYREPPPRLFWAGFVIAVSGVALVSTAGGQALQVSLPGAALVLAGNVLWAVYTILLRRIDGKDALLDLRRIFFWGVLSLLACLPLMGFEAPIAVLCQPNVLVPVLVLGVMTSALTFLAYNLSVGWLGAAKASVYTYFPPAVGALAAHFILGEHITPAGLVGIGVIIAGLLLSERAGGKGAGGEEAGGDSHA